jgi:hypothetical protein
MRGITGRALTVALRMTELIRRRLGEEQAGEEAWPSLAERG